MEQNFCEDMAELFSTQKLACRQYVKYRYCSKLFSFASYSTARFCAQSQNCKNLPLP